LKKLVLSKIPAFQGRDARNNQLILETLALTGPLIKYDIFKELKKVGVKHYPTISRRVDDLKRRGYIETAGTRLVKVGKRREESSTYGITWRGFIASLAIETIRKNIPIVLERNFLLEKVLPESVPKQIIINILNELFSQEELEVITGALLEGFLRAIPENIELIKEEEYIAYIIPALIKSPNVWSKISEKDLSKLFQIQGMPELFLKLIENFETQLIEMLEVIQTIKKQLKQFIIYA